MLAFISRRLIASVFVLLGASFIIYVLAAYSGDPLEDLRGSTSPNRDALIAARTEQLNLDVPPVARYFLWLSGVLGAFIGQFDLGVTVDGREVIPLIGSAMWQTIQLVTIATVIAAILGIAIGMSTALRQYSGYDYTVTFFSFLFFSLPVFFVAVLLKEYLAIGFNDFLSEPAIPWWVTLVVALLSGLVWSSIVGGALRSRGVTFGVAALVAAAVLVYIEVTDWFTTPGLGIPLVLVLGLLTAAVATSLTTGWANRRGLIAAGGMAVFGAAMWYPMQYVLTVSAPGWLPVVLVVGFVVIGAVVGWALGQNDRAVTARAAGITAGVVALLLVIDRAMQSWPDYVQRTNGRPIATIGASTPNLEGSIWLGMLDSFTHLVLPTITLLLISVASYSRYSRSSLLEVMNQDYVRTARAKGLTERTVVMRHAFRNSMIPITTVIAFDVGALIGGAVLTETVFAWRGMGSVFQDALTRVDLNPLMAFILITSAVTVIFNFVADLLYSVLDPRIRVH